jgi:serine/threonine-protein kinase RsbW
LVAAPKGLNLNDSYPAIASSVPRARSAVADFALRAGATSEVLDSVRLAVSEAVTNAVVHAYRGRPGNVEVTVAVASGELWVLVSDDGCGFQTPAEAPGLGLGMSLIADSCDELAIAERATGGTEVRMGFVLDPQAAELD